MGTVINITTGLTIWCSEAATLAAVLFFAWRHDRQMPAYLMWAFGFATSAVGFALVAARGLLPDILTVEIGNAVAMLGESAWIARKSGGGGHREAAGFSSDLSVDEITEFIVREVTAQVGSAAKV